MQDRIHDFFDKIGLASAHSEQDMFNRLASAGGANWCATVCDYINEDKTNSEEFYHIKNSNCAGSFELSSAWDNDIIRGFAIWIDEHSDLFFGDILDIGCDNGILSIFLAYNFPNSHITAIDRCSEAVENARRLAEKCNIKNIEFIVSSAEDFTGKYDTVFSARTMHENMQSSSLDTLAFLSEQAQVYKKSLAYYASALTKLVKDDGLLILIDRTRKNAVYLGWLYALNSVSRVPLTNYHKTILAAEGNKISGFQAMPFFNLSSETEDSIFDIFTSICMPDIDPNADSFSGEYADLILDLKRLELIEGYDIYDQVLNNFRYASYTIWTDRHYTEGILFDYKRADSDEHKIISYHISDKEQLLKYLRDAVNDLRKDPANVVVKL